MLPVALSGGNKCFADVGSARARLRSRGIPWRPSEERSAPLPSVQRIAAEANPPAERHARLQWRSMGSKARHQAQAD